MNRKLAVSFSTVVVCLATVAAFSIFPSSAAPNTNWSSWRGSEGTGISAETNLPTEWSPEKNIKWKAALPGRGHSSPIVWENKIFLTTDI
jgi:outer membrane protein assembly factor BamB